MKNASVYKAIFSNIGGCVFFIAIFAPAIACAQTRGTVEVVKDARIDTLAAHRSRLRAAGATGNAAAYSTSGYGYRVQIYNGSSRKEAYDAQARFNQQYGDMRTYISYSEPDYKVRAGDFRTRLEAERLMQELRGKFTGLFIIAGKINPPKTTTGND
ncbi:SPOR domain-containing protein [Mucilaginibacter sp. UR6-11]|uniref:SPOR domain-containing protein n=1 Tax=Mucilaginibacter sp. UR6-11 TaxID=1435644 RepID=UPI001E38B442|nr:SPOR domain-containing protein [Mucilaginibacter sp. UR6-11]MCC8425115.1 SPOR domain-containing protein [Mucilaginibacter sp. UR6-11]